MRLLLPPTSGVYASRTKDNIFGLAAYLFIGRTDD